MSLGRMAFLSEQEKSSTRVISVLKMKYHYKNFVTKIISLAMFRNRVVSMLILVRTQHLPQCESGSGSMKPKSMRIHADTDPA
jgi:hypothetical protein